MPVALYDQHLHSRHSVDSEADPRENVLRAIELGLGGLTFTEHFDSHPTEWSICRYDYGQIAETIAALRREFGDRIFIGHGIEICYQPEQMERLILPYLAAHRFDVVLYSVHWFKGRALHVREHWDGLDVQSGTRLYLETTLEAVCYAGELRRSGLKPFDILSHLDLVKRYTQRFFKSFDIRSHAGLVDEILAASIEADLVPEVNLSSLRQQLSEPMPAEWVVQRYAELGGEAMSLGSDAHNSEDIGAGIAEAARMLRRCGIRRLAVFKNRERHDEPL
jgi:histidinol-phosphatase (PHP family)